MGTNLPAFINCLETEELILELRTLFKEKGANINVENTQDGNIVSNLNEALQVCDVVLKGEGVGAENVEYVFNIFVTVILLIPIDQSEELITTLCEKLSNEDEFGPSKLQVLNNLFHGLDESCSLRFTVYSTMVKLAGKTDQMTSLETDLDKIKTWMGLWDVSMVKYQGLLRTLHEGQLACDNGDMATKVMIELLGTYTEANASQARDDAQKCIVTCIANPQTFVMDHLLQLKPVKFLEGEAIHDLLTIFVSGKLQHYTQFHERKPDFISSIGLSHEACLQKMRMLTLMSIAETQTEISFDRLCREMKLTEQEVERFILEVVRTKAVRAKIDQVNDQVLLSSTTHRTFGKPQWQQLRDSLVSWQNNLGQVLGSLDSLMHHVATGAAQPE